MNLFIHQTYIKVFDKNWQPTNKVAFYDWKSEAMDFSRLQGDVWVNVSFLPILAELMQSLIKNRFPKLQNLYLQVPDKRSAKQFIKTGFTTLEAAGGVVHKQDKILMIYRLGKWDLPKGKLEQGEEFEVAAIREVEEECSVQVKLKEKVVTTWHYYQDFRGKNILKRTKWYTMDCLNDSNMKPQTEENIEKIEWMSKEDVWKAQQNTYRTIQLVLSRNEQLKSNANH